MSTLIFTEFRLNTQELPVSLQADYFKEVMHILQKEVALRIAESTIAILEITETIELSKPCYEDNIGIQNYREYDPGIRFEYIQRDKSVLAKIQEDDDLRYYIEKKTGKKAEEIFSYASENYKS